MNTRPWHVTARSSPFFVVHRCPSLSVALNFPLSPLSMTFLVHAIENERPTASMLLFLDKHAQFNRFLLTLLRYSSSGMNVNVNESESENDYM